MQEARVKRLLTQEEFDEYIKLCNINKKKADKYIESLREELWEEIIQK